MPVSNTTVAMHCLLQVHQVLYSRKWEARVYAGEALAELASRISHPSCQDIAENVENSVPCTISTSLDCFNYAVILATRPPLVSSGDQVRLHHVGVMQPQTTEFTACAIQRTLYKFSHR